MMWRSISALAVAALLGGCGKASDTSARPVAAPQYQPGPATDDSAGTPRPSTADGLPQREAALTPPGPAPSGSTPGASAADLAGVLDALTQALRKYSFEQHRLPKTLSEVVAAGYVKDMPLAPAGKKFGIDARTVQVVLVKQ